MSDSDLIPLMYQAQTADRGKIQYVGGRRSEEEQPATEWLGEWLDGCPGANDLSQEDVPLSRVRTVKTSVKMPGFGKTVHVWEYTLKWRMVTNSGIDEGIIRPVIGSKGIPFYPGSSMKGAFLRACLEIAPEKAVDYCGGEVEEIINGKVQKRTKPGVLRFHGGYPVNMSWGNSKNKKRLLDVVHNQQEKQVIRNVNSSANVQISLYKTKFKFGFSRNKNNRDVEVDWDLVKTIWERALSEGLGSRTSAGYGKFKEVENNKAIASVDLSGRGLVSQLLNEEPEFRPNMFKAALRGHTLRLLAGVTDEETTQRLTKELWGGFIQGNDGRGSVVGKFGIDFKIEGYDGSTHKYSPGNSDKEMLMYILKSGKLDIVPVLPTSAKEEEFITMLIKFSLLLGGFGKSWRRVHHKMFYDSYLKPGDKPMIGCHWSFSKLSQAGNYCIITQDETLDNIANFLSEIPDKVRNCFDLPSRNIYVRNWRDVWHPRRVQVWGRIADSRKDSQAVEWFHLNNFIKRTELTGSIGRNSQVSRIWHRMYPLIIRVNDKLKLKKNAEGNLMYVELLTIFTPDNSRIAERFLDFLDSDGNDFEKLWGGS